MWREPTYYFPKDGPENNLFTKAIKNILKRVIMTCLRTMKWSVTRVSLDNSSEMTSAGWGAVF